MSEDHPHKSRPTYREMARCVRCSAWWSVPAGSINGDAPMCPCGGALALVDMQAHMGKLPVAQPIPVPVPPKPK